MNKPKGLKLFCQSTDTDAMEIRAGNPLTATNYAFVFSDPGVFLDADQLDKLAERCKQWSKYLRSQKPVKPVPPKKWEDVE